MRVHGVGTIDLTYEPHEKSRNCAGSRCQPKTTEQNSRENDAMAISVINSIVDAQNASF